MIVDRNDNVEIKSQGFGRSENMSIDENSLQHIMTVLTNLYSDPELAVIREYSTNAYDSHVEAGKGDVPIDVRLPDTFEPIFRIRDYGVGLSEAEVYDIYGRYGASTKRESNEFVGQLGLGCKSALTLTEQFTLIAIKDGIKNTFNIHMDETGIPTISHAHRVNTDEGNGVEIIVPVKNPRSFIDKARSFYRFFPVTPNFVGTSLDIPELDVFMEFSDKVKMVRNVPNNVVVMGGVPYRADEFFIKSALHYTSFKFVIYADVGEVNFTPSREELHYTKKTRDFLDEAEKLVAEKIRQQIQTEIDSAATYWEAHEIYNSMDYQFMRFARNVSSGTDKDINPTYGGIPIPLQFQNVIPTYRMDYNGRFSKESVRGTQDFFRTRGNTVILKGNSATFSSNYKSRMKKWAEDNNHGKMPLIIYLGTHDKLSKYTPSPDPVFGAIKVLTYEDDLKQYKLARNASKKQKVTELEFDRVSFEYYQAVYVPEKIDTSKPIIMVSRKDVSKIKNMGGSTTNFLQRNFNIYVVNKPQRKEFVKVYKPFETVFDAVRASVDAINSKVQDSVLTKVFGQSYSPQYMDRYQRIFNTSLMHVKDPELKKFIDLINSEKNLLTESEVSVRDEIQTLHNVTTALSRQFSHPSNHELWNRVGKAREAAEKEARELEDRLINRYPFLARFPEKDALLNFINSLYETRKDDE